MRVLVVTVVHDPRDARISHRQIDALLKAGHTVTFAAPFSAFDVPARDSVHAIDLPRAHGRDRVRSLRAAARLLHGEGAAYDVVLLHDPELLLAAVGVRGPVVVWDVHEDTAAAMTLKPWLPRPVRGVAAAATRRLEAVAERRYRLLLAEDSYRRRFRRPHPVVPNSTPAPSSVLPSGDGRVVYVGSLTHARGADDMRELARLLRPDGIDVHLVGPAEGEVAARLESAERSGWLRWHGFLPNDEAMALVDGAMAGLSLLHDEPNYRHSRPTKVVEYMSHGVPVVTTPLPSARDLVLSAGCGLVVPFRDPVAAREAVLTLRADPELRRRLADAGRATALAQYDWSRDAEAFVTTLESWAAGARNAV